ncbi:MAG: PhzF family phenazine biosynthesis protein [Lachnospiraceae bacterium]|nr:PhzF family phenazine biosynthesis protein [Lachnospiraceae bacterium]
MKQYIVDAFTKEVFHGNPAAVCVMERWIPDDVMQKIAIENSLSETAFVVKEGERYHIRWFTPGKEVDLCGHATLGSAYVLSRFYGPEESTFVFDSLSGKLIVSRDGDLLKMDFPSRMPEEIEFSQEMKAAINGLEARAYLSRDVMLVLEREDDVMNFCPDYSKIMGVSEGMGLFITAPSGQYDFVSRTFFPKIKVNEDPVCGSAHCNFIPYWSKRLGKKKMTAYQASPRGGVVYCKDMGERVEISGNAVLYSESDIMI